ncbi:MAG: MogA/MoaB family molybdenum cofactor biosynthesis protein [Saccharofermentanales bacterium]
MNASYVCAVITASDSTTAGTRRDDSGPDLISLLKDEGFADIRYEVVPDDFSILQSLLLRLIDEDHVNLILTTGGTGFSPRDITPEATRAVIEREAPGIAEAIRSASLAITPRAMLSRAIAGIRGKCLIINMPGSPKAVRECFGVIRPVLGHALDILCENAGNCAR